MIFDDVLAADPVAAESLAAWWDATETVRTGHAATIDRALAGGARSDRLGYAFAGGYAAALYALVPALGGSIAALCATEAKGAHPRAIKTALVPDGGGGYTVTGKKKWATVANLASSLLVVATTGDGADGVPRLRVVRVPASAPGIAIRPTTAPFVPEIPHAELDLERVVVTEADVLPGDGYTHYLKPFRTVEDLHVHAALLGYLIGVARRYRLPQLARLVALAATTRALAELDRDAATTHVALAGLIELVGPVVGELEAAWAAAGGEEHARWLRDRPLLAVASAARTARLEKARSVLGLA